MTKKTKALMGASTPAAISEFSAMGVSGDFAVLDLNMGRPVPEAWYKGAGCKATAPFKTEREAKTAANLIQKTYGCGKLSIPVAPIVASQVSHESHGGKPNAEKVMAEILAAYRNLEYTDPAYETKLTLPRVQKLLDAGYTPENVATIWLGYGNTHEVGGDLYGSLGLFGYADSEKEGGYYVDEYIERYEKTASTKNFQLALKNPDFDWSAIVKKYNIDTKGNQIQEIIDVNFVRDYIVFSGTDIVITAAVKDWTGTVKYMQPGQFNGGYWNIVSSKKEVIDDVAHMLFSQPKGYVKEFDIYINVLGGTDPEVLTENGIKFAKGGKIETDEVKAAKEAIDNLSTEYNSRNGEITYEQLLKSQLPYKDIINRWFLKNNKKYDVLNKTEEDGYIETIYLEAPKEFDGESKWLHNINNNIFPYWVKGGLDGEIKDTRKNLKSDFYDHPEYPILQKMKKQKLAWLPMLLARKSNPYIQFEDKKNWEYYHKDDKSGSNRMSKGGSPSWQSGKPQALTYLYCKTVSGEGYSDPEFKLFATETDAIAYMEAEVKQWEAGGYTANRLEPGNVVPTG